MIKKYFKKAFGKITIKNLYADNLCYTSITQRVFHK